MAYVVDITELLIKTLEHFAGHAANVEFRKT